VPGNFGEPTHTELAALRESPRWRSRLAAAEIAVPAVEEPTTYLAELQRLDLVADVWETTYLQVLPGPHAARSHPPRSDPADSHGAGSRQAGDAVVEWMRGTALRPVLSVLEPDEQEAFVAEYRERVRPAYPATAAGTVLPYRRIFAVAHALLPTAGGLSLPLGGG
jgi:trans-aconitate 2-methyltransferase